MTAELIRHLWQSTFFALAAGLLTLAFRKNRASVRYWLWLSASLKFFVPFTVLLNLGRSLDTRMPAVRQIATPAVSYTLEQFSGASFAEGLPATAPAPDTIHWIPIAIMAVWLCGFSAVALIRFRNWLHVRAAVRTSTASSISATVEVRVSPGLLEPGVVGLVRPVLLLPEGIAKRLTSSELSAVLSHERCHIRRRDNLFAALHMMVEAIFWFHPLVWWIGARLVDERERACDEEVLSQGNQPGVYADAILNICKLYVESPIACVSGVSGASIRQRIETIMSNRRLHGLNRAKKLLLTAAGFAALAGPIAVGLLIGTGSIPVIHAQPPVAAPPAPIQLVQAERPSTTAPAPAPKFDVVSVKPCKLANFGGGTRGGGGGRGPGTAGTSPGRLSIGCKPVSDLIYWAYITFADDPLVNVFTGLATPHEEGRIRGGQPWSFSDTYTIEAETDDPVANGPSMPPDPAFRRMFGPMLRQLLEDRFQLKLHRDAEDAPMYALTVAPGGFKLKPMDPGDCVSMDEFDHHFDIANPVYDPKMKGPCGEGGLVLQLLHGPNRTLRMNGTLAQLAGRLHLDRQVIDRTGISGIFSIGIEYSDNPTSAPAPTGIGVNGGLAEASDISPAPSIYTVLEQQLGLKLVAVKAPKGYIVIDRVERPSEN